MKRDGDTENRKKVEKRERRSAAQAYGENKELKSEKKRFQIRERRATINHEFLFLCSLFTIKWGDDYKRN